MRERENIGDPNSNREFSRKESDFPTDPEERLAALLASYNTGPKSVTHLLLPPQGYISTGDIGRRFKEAFSGTEIQQFRIWAIEGYCRNTLSPIGLVTREYTIDYFGVEKLVGYGLTDAGIKYGTPAAALSLDFEQRNAVSLYPIFGQTQTPSPTDQRAPYTRARILRFLESSEQPLREADLCTALSVGHATVKDALQTLAKAGVVEYEALTPHTGKNRITYSRGELSPDEVTVYRSHKSGTKIVMEICAQLDSEGLPITLVDVLSRYPRDSESGEISKGRRARVSGILTHLASQDYITHDKFKGQAIQSSAQITDLGRTVVVDYLNPLVALVSDNEETQLRLQRGIVPRVVGNLGDYARSTAEVYYEHSKSYKRKQKQERRDGVLNLISATPGISLEELSQATGMHRQTVFQYLKPLIEIGQLEWDIIKGVHYYKFKTADDNLTGSPT